MLAVSAAASASAYVAQEKAAKANAKYESNMYSATAQSANTNYQQTISQTNLATYQTDTAERQQAIDNSQAINSAKASTVVQEGEAGVAGNTLSQLLGNFDRIHAQNNFTLNTNQDWRQQQTQQNLLAARANAANQITSATPHPVQMPSILATALQIGSSAYSAYDNYARDSRTGPYNLNSTSTNWMYKSWI